MTWQVSFSLTPAFDRLLLADRLTSAEHGRIAVFTEKIIRRLSTYTSDLLAETRRLQWAKGVPTNSLERLCESQGTTLQRFQVLERLSACLGVSCSLDLLLSFCKLRGCCVREACPTCLGMCSDVRLHNDC
jgi:hypothetical protein